MGSFSLISLCTLSLFCCSCLIQAQQPYVGLKTTDCTNPDTSDSVLGYTCNGLNRSCQSYLVFRSQPSFNTATSIANLLASDPSQVAEINEVSETATFETNQLVIVPVNCSCSGEHYQVNTTYTIQSGDGYLLIANNTFQALSTCQAIQNQQPDIRPSNLTVGMRITVPLRCACPTKNQTDVGINYLLSYLVAQGDEVSGISEMFGADYERTLEANQLLEPGINFFTTLLIPLQDPPSRITVPSPPPPPASAPPPPPSSPPSGSSNQTWIYILVGVLGGGALILVVCIVIFCVFFCKSKKKPDLIITSESFEAHEKPPKKLGDEESQDFLDSMSSIAQSLNLKAYKFEELQLATDNFSPSSQIKGSVYRGVIKGDFAAIKKVHGDVSKEIELLNKVNHSNLIRLSGVGFNDGHWYLVYEYAANGALSDWIFHNKDNSGKYLSWKQKIQIALDVATGLNYLHSFTNPPHVHKDLKSSNVLLDGDFRAKIANFALARSTEGQGGQFALTRHIVGTKGYMAPEYLENGLVSTKLDVYAFGVLLLEVITGKEAAAIYGVEYMKLSDILSNVLHEKDGQEGLNHLIDPSMLENYPSELAIVVVNLINSCLKIDPIARPAMDEIVKSLSRILTSSSACDSSSNVSWSQASTGSY
ncbi:hypothetical protein REPUB_Repub10bG0156900 [Reevesia pubescens]